MHGENNKDRIKKCQAYGKKCPNCNKENHFASKCRSAKSAAVPVENKAPEKKESPSVGGFLSSITLSKNVLVSSVKSAETYLQSIRSKVKSNVNS